MMVGGSFFSYFLTSFVTMDVGMVDGLRMLGTFPPERIPSLSPPLC